jgi:hypothetical protein
MVALEPSARHDGEVQQMNTLSRSWSRGQAAPLREAHPAVLAPSRKDTMAEAVGTTLLAFTLRELETGWSWRVFDICGELVAAGQAATKAGARDAVADAYAANGAAVPTQDA